MAVDNTLRYRGFNSYELAPNETLYSSLSDCEYLGFVTTQWVALKVGGTIAGGEVRIVWIDDTGGQLGATERHTFTPTRLWERHTWTVAVPPEAVKLRIQFEGGTQGYHFACPMTEPGEIASSFDPNIASAVAYMTSEGAYVGFLNADQITAGLLRAVNGGAWFDLDKPEIVMEGKQADLSITPENPLKLTDKSGNFIGGLGLVEGLLGLVAGVLTNDPNMNAYGRIGYPPAGGAGLEFVNGKQRYVLNLSIDGGVSLIDSNDMQRLIVYADGSFAFNNADGQRFLIDADGDTHVSDNTKQLRLLIGANGDTYIYDQKGVVRLWIAANGNTFMQNDANSHAIGVDGSGPYFTKSGTKSYLGKLPESWKTPTLLNGWVNLSTPYAQVRYYKDEFGVVHIKGFVRSGVENTIFVLPDGYFPTETMYFPTIADNNKISFIAITQTGEVNKPTALSVTNWISINGISFKVGV